MKRLLNLQIGMTLFLAAAPLAAMAQTTFFTDTFGSSTTNGPSIVGGSPTASYTSYDIASSKNTIPVTNGVTIAQNDLHLALAASTTSGYLEAQAMFVTNSPGGTNAISLNNPGDYIEIDVVFTNTVGTLLAGGIKSALWIGLYNSAGSYYPTNIPVAGALASNGLSTTTGSIYAAGNCANWQGYVGYVVSGASSITVTRPVQNGSTESANQELLGDDASGGTYDNPKGTTIATAPSAAVPLTTGGTYTLDLRLTLNAPGSLTISNFIYSGAGINGAVVFSQGSTGITNATFLTSAFDGFAIGAYNSGTGYDPIMDISSITITGQSTVVNTPPTITSQPSPVIVATNGSCAFFVSATDSGSIVYQWCRNGTNLIDGGNISGSASSQLVISPAGTNDVLSSANGYYVTVTGPGNFSTNSVTNSLALIPATSLIYSGSGPWDLNTSASWLDTNLNPGFYFNFGDPVTFDDNGGGGHVTLTGSYLSAASVTVNSQDSYTFQGSGSFAGPGGLLYEGSGQFTITNANTYSGGTIISNATANLRLGILNGLGTGPVTMAMGQMELLVSGSSSSGIAGDIIVAGDSTFQFDGTGTYAGVFNGDLSGSAVNTLTLVPSPNNTTTVDRIRFAGTNTVCNANLFLNSPLITLAPYNGSGVQVYNGVISGSGGMEQKGVLTYYNGANTYTNSMTLATGAVGLGTSTVGSPGSISSGPLGTGPLLLFVDSTSASPSASAGLFASGGACTIANAIQYPSSTNNLTLIVGGTNNLTFTGPVNLNGNDAYYPPVYTNRTFQVTNTATTTFSGVISDQTNGVTAGYGFTLTGSGVLALNNAETYTGPTIVSNGTLQVNGSLNAASAVTVATNAILAGSGAINGTVFVGIGGAIGGGASSIGTLTINNNLTNSGNVIVRVNTSRSPSQSNDVISVSGVLTNAGTGTVTVTNLGPALVAGDRFVLFNKGLANGNAMTISTSGLPGNVIWTNNLALDGSISVVTSNSVIVPTIPPTISTFSLSSGNLAISATNGVNGGTYYLLESTNVATPLKQWKVVATNVITASGGSKGFTFTGTNAVTGGSGQQFYILSSTNE
jgi:autotransporter-associated beta strand protein